MADDGFNGSVLDFASVTLGPTRSIEFRESAAKADVSGSGDSVKTHKVGIPEQEVSVTFVGACPAASADVGDAGALSVVWQDDGVEGTIANVEVSERSSGGSMDGEILSSMTFVPAPT